MPHRDEIAIVSIRVARAAMSPRHWRTASSIELRHGMSSCVIELARVAGNYGAVTRERVFFVCPSCGALRNAVGFTYTGVGCRTCQRWRSREYKVTRKAPHVGPVTVPADLSPRVFDEALLPNRREMSDLVRVATDPRAVAGCVEEGARPYRDEIAIVSIRTARGSMTPRQWREASTITLRHGMSTCVVELARVHANGAIKHKRAWLVCPTCRGLRNALAFADSGVGCRTCQRWRSRERRVRRKVLGVDHARARWTFDDASLECGREDNKILRPANNPRAVDDDWLRAHAATNRDARIPDRIAAWAEHTGRTVSYGAMWNALARIGGRHTKG